MSTPHNEANIGDIAKTVVMPGDPLRAKYIAENFLEDYRLVNQVRGMYAYTGKYKGKEITVMAHGMGMPSVGIYTHELYNIYNVDNIIRIGSCGAYTPDLNLFDIVLSESVFSESTYALNYNNDDCHIVKANEELNKIIEETAKKTNINITKGNTVSVDVFDPYMTDRDKTFSRIPKDFNAISGEMEAFALIYIANLAGKKATCLMSVVDSPFIDVIATPNERQTSLNNMIKLALESTLEIN